MVCLLENNSLFYFYRLLNIAVTSHLCCYVKLIVSCLDYTTDSFPR